MNYWLDLFTGTTCDEAEAAALVVSVPVLLKLCDRLEEGKNLIKYLKPEFLDDIAELYSPEDEMDAS